ncbi:E3 SUMO-protein ligase ZBED1-like [Thunnus maccoyii]|uniref:E3 SUMO-protein ligase ZBED1-like n=1 Tax=Thunnus maccoyii TaxID=8240 RepID=UPI001C4AE1B2|nr:E3 SUMO-protein ligase ZBED1-like [Thunnus maccoyii]
MHSYSTTQKQASVVTHQSSGKSNRRSTKIWPSVVEKNMLHAASTLDPRFKALPFLSQDEQQDIRSKVIAEAAALEQEEPEDHAEEPDGPGKGLDDDEAEGPASKRRTSSSSLVNLLGKTFAEVRIVFPKSAHTTAEEEMKQYLEVPPLSLSEDPLSWWRSHEIVFPLMAKLAKRYLCIPGTSIAAERVFSSAGDIVTAQWSMLTPEHVEQLLFLQKNLDISDSGGLVAAVTINQAEK